MIARVLKSLVFWDGQWRALARPLAPDPPQGTGFGRQPFGQSPFGGSNAAPRT